MSNVSRSRPIVSTNINHFLENGGVAMATHDQYMKIKWCNNAFIDMFKYKEDLVGKTLFDLCPREVDRVSRFVSKFREGRSNTVSTSLHMRTGEGTDRYIVINSEKFMSSNGVIDEIISCFRDDTKRMIREDRIKTALESSSHVSKHRGMFISKIVHELRSPVTELMLTMGRKDKSLPHALSLSRQIKNMTYATKFEMGEFIVPTEEICCIGDVVRTSIDTSKVGVTVDINAEITYTVTVDEKDIDDSSLFIKIDETLVSTVLSELIRNCCQIKDILVSINVNLDTISKKITFKVSDNGPGMNLSWIMRVFQDFWGENTNKPNNIIESMSTDVPGMGIGLNICYNIVQCMNSMLEVKTSHEGTEFWFVLDSVLVEDEEIIRERTSPSDAMYNWSKMYPETDDNDVTRIIQVANTKQIKSGKTKSVTSTSSIVDRIKKFVSKSGANKQVEPQKNPFDEDSCDDSNSSIAVNVEYEAPVRVTYSKTPYTSASHSKASSNSKGKPFSNSNRSSDRAFNVLGDASIRTGDAFSPHVLIVDDNTIVRKLTGKILTNIGCTFDTADNGALAVEKVKKHHEYFYDLVLMDLRMPLMNGLEATRIITQDLQLTVPIVAFTAEASIEVFKEALDCGVIGFLHKPATHENIEHTVDRYARRI